MPKLRDQKVQKSLLNYFSASQNPTQNEIATNNLNEDQSKKPTVVIESPTLNEKPVTTTATEMTPREADSEPMDLDNLLGDQEPDTTMQEIAEDSEEDELIHRPHKRKKRRIIEEDESTQEVKESDIDDQPAQKHNTRRIINIEHEDEDEDEDKEKEKEDNEDEDEDDVVTIHPKKKIRHIVLDDDDDDDDDDDEGDISPKEHTDKDDFKEDLDFLDRTDILKERTRGKQVSRYTEALKKLKDKKGKLAEYNNVEKGPIEPFIVLSSSEEDEEDNVDEEEEEEEEDFIVDDDIIDGEKVTTANTEKAELPAEFSKGRTLSFKRHLETYILYLIELTLNPVFDISCSSKYNLAKDAVMRRIQSYRDSIVTSDVWLPSFKEAVDKYPNWHISRPYVGDDFISCEACRSNKPATIEVKLSSDTIPTTETFYMGSECCRKGEMYHQFNHFSSHMYKQVSELVNKARKKMKASDRGQSTMIFNNLVHSGDIKKLTDKVKRRINDMVMIYNLKGQRSRIEFESSSSDDDDDETD